MTNKPTKTVAAAKAAAKRKTRASAGARLLSRREVLAKVPVSYPTIWKWMREGTFPRSRDIGGKCAWVEAELDDWIANLNVVPLKGDADRPTREAKERVEQGDGLASLKAAWRARQGGGS